MRHEARRIRRMRREKAAKIRRRRIAIKMTALVMALAAIATAGVGALTTVFARESGAVYQTVIVEKGDTLWDIASEYNISNRDVRRMVDAIMAANDMTSAQICAGDRLYIPIY